MTETTLDIPFPGTDGLSFFCTEAGDGEPAFLLLHGFTLNSGSWADVMPALAARGRVVAYDRIPFGRSQKVLPRDWTRENPYTPDATLHQLGSAMDATGLGQAVVVGNSAGGLLAARAALAWPERVTALVLVCPAILGGPPAGVSRVLDTRPLNAVGPTIARRLGNPGWLLRRSFHDPQKVDAARLERASIATRFAGWDRALWEFVKVSTAQPDISAELGKLRQPVLIVGGAHDRVVAPERQRELAAALPDAELAVMADAGHLPHEEQPAAFMRVVGGWLARRGV